MNYDLMCNELIVIKFVMLVVGMDVRLNFDLCCFVFFLILNMFVLF